jgi:hypothetical protein
MVNVFRTYPRILKYSRPVLPVLEITPAGMGRKAFQIISFPAARFMGDKVVMENLT